MTTLLSEEGMVAICPHIGNLTTLKLYDFSFSMDDIIDTFTRQLTNLRKLEMVNGAEFTDEAMKVLTSRLTKLESLNLEGFYDLTHEFVPYIVDNLINLTDLSIRECGISDTCIQLICNLSKLQHLSIGSYPSINGELHEELITNIAMQTIGENLKNLKTLSLTGISSLNYFVLIELRNYLPDTHIYISYCSGLASLANSDIPPRTYLSYNKFY